MARFGPFELDSRRHLLLRDGREIHLTPKAFDLLAALIGAAPRVVGKAELHQKLWPNGVVTDATLVGLVKEIRRALDDRDRSAPIVRTIQRVGYAFAAPLVVAVPRSRLARWLIAGERRIALADGENLIGRAAEATVCLDDSTVSRRHARLVVSDASAVLEDLGSKNGTTVGSIRLKAAVVLRDGDRFVCGVVPVTYRESTAGLPTATRISRAGASHSRT